MSSVLRKSIQYENLSNVFTEVHHNETLNLLNNEQLRLFHLSLTNSSFDYTQLVDYLINIISEYVFSRTQAQNLCKNNSPTSLGIRAIKTMKANDYSIHEGTGNELGEILLYAFLEEFLNAPKLFSKVELNSMSASYGKECDAIHLLSINNTSIPCFETVYGASNIAGDIKVAIDKAFERIVKIEHSPNAKKLILADTHIFEEAFDKETSEKILNLMIPDGNTKIINDNAYGVFLGYSLGLQQGTRNNLQYLQDMSAKMQIDIKNHASYIAAKIKSLNLNNHSFYFYIIPFNDADNDKIKIIDDLFS